MKIVSVDIVAFGKLKNFKLNFNKDVNVILQHNSFGKSTLASFVRAMLYGLEYRKQSMYSAKNFLPWDSGGKFGGSMTLEHNGRQFRIERQFGATSRTDQAKLIDLSTGQDIATDSIGEYLLGLTAQSYEQSVYIPQETVTLANNQDFETKLSGMVQGDQEENNYNKAMDRLRQYSKSYKLERGRGGLIAQLEDKLNDAHYTLKQAIDNKANEEKLRQADQANKQRIVELEQQQKKLNQQIASLNAQQVALSRTQQDTERVKQVQQAKQFVTKYDINQILQDKSKLEQLNFASQHKTTTSSASSKIKWIVLIAIILAIAISAVGIFLVIEGQQPTGSIVIVVGLVVLCIALGVYILRPNKGTKATDDSTKQLADIVSRYQMPQDTDTQTALQTIVRLENTYNTSQTMVSMFGGLDTERIQRDQQLQRNIEGDISALTDRLSEVTNERDAIMQQTGDISRRLATIAEGVDIISTKDKIAELTQQLDNANTQYNNVQLAMQILDTARQELSTAYIPQLAHQASQLVSKATDGQFGAVLVNGEFDIQLTEQGSTHPIDCYSRGVRELTTFCFRVALSNMVFQGKVPFLIVDDTFVNLDEKHFHSAVSLLKLLAKQGTQIIYMTCHDRSKQAFAHS